MSLFPTNHVTGANIFLPSGKNLVPTFFRPANFRRTFFRMQTFVPQVFVPHFFVHPFFRLGIPTSIKLRYDELPNCDIEPLRFRSYLMRGYTDNFSVWR